MHELSIAISMIEVAEEEATRLGASQVNAIHVRIGALSGVVKEALASAFELARENTQLEKTSLIFEEISQSRELLITAMEIE